MTEYRNWTKGDVFQRSRKEKLTTPVRHLTRRLDKPWSLRSFAGFIFIPFMMIAFVSGGYASDKQFSMQIQGKPLAAVIQDLAKLSGSKIVFDEAWADLPITVRFVNLTLEKAITKILTNFNHVVIFEPGNIQVKIYGAVSLDKSDYQAPVAVQPPNRAPDDHRIKPSVSPSHRIPRQDDDMNDSTLAETAEIESPEETEKEEPEKDND